MQGGRQTGRRSFYLACFGMCINRGLSAFIPPVYLSLSRSLPLPANGGNRDHVVMWNGNDIIQRRKAGMREGDASTIFFCNAGPEQCHRAS